MIIRNIFLVATVVLAGINIMGCKKFVQVGSPPNQLLSSDVFGDEATAVSAITGVYARMASGNGFASGGSNSVTVLSGLSSDEFLSFSNSNAQEFVVNNLSPTNPILLSSVWNDAYQYIYSVNSIIEGLQASSSLSSTVKSELTGEAKFMRAFCYFYLVNLFGDVPLHLTSSYQNNSISPRSLSSQVYDQIIADLKEAQGLLPDDFSISNSERVRPNKGAATALLARVYLYNRDWSDAETQSNNLINNSLYQLLPDLDQVFLANSHEAIWQLLPVSPNINTQEGATFILMSDPTTVSLSDNLREAFEANDLRNSHWVNSFSDGPNTWYYPYKYKVKSGSALTEYSMVFRLAEQFLIRAEARAQMSDISGAQDDLNAIRHRAGLPNSVATDQSSLLLAIEHERQIELFAEWGHRWLDLKRTQRADAVLGPLKSPGWQATDTLYPIPEYEIQNNHNIDQNKGY